MASAGAGATSSPARHLVQTDIGTLALKHWLPAGASVPASAPASALQSGAAPTSPLVVLLHGMFGDSDVWAATALNLSRAGLEVIAFDLPGHGASNTHIVTPDETVDALAAALNDTAGTRPLLLVGQSFGTLIATRLMSRLNADAAHPAQPARVAGLVLLSPVGLGTEVNRDFLLGVMSAAEAEDVTALEKAFAPLTVRRYRSSPTYMQGLCARIAAAAEQLYVFIDATVDITGQQRVSLIDDLAAASVPVALVHGREDAVLPWQQTLNAPPEVALHLPEHVGHMPHWEANALVSTLIRRAAASAGC